MRGKDKDKGMQLGLSAYHCARIVMVAANRNSVGEGRRSVGGLGVRGMNRSSSSD